MSKIFSVCIFREQTIQTFFLIIYIPESKKGKKKQNVKTETNKVCNPCAARDFHNIFMEKKV